MRPPRWLRSRWAILAGIWSVPGLIEASKEYVLSSYRGVAFDLGGELLLDAHWLYWVPATLLVVALRRRVPPATSRWGSNILVHLLATAVVGAGDTLLLYGLGRLGGGPPFLHRETMQRLEARLDPGLFVRIHRSRLVNRARIRELRWQGRRELFVVLADGHSLRVARSCRARLESGG